MAVLVYIESENNNFKKSSYEALSYGKALAEMMKKSLCGIVFNCSDFESLKAFGVDKILNIDNNELKDFSSKKYASAISEVIKSESINVVVLSSSPDSKFLGAHLSGMTESSFVSNVVELPDTIDPFVVKRTCFTNKAFSTTELISDLKILSIESNCFGLVEKLSDPKIENFEIKVISSNQKIKSIEKENGSVNIADAEIVVSGGRGLKGPENWGMIEKLADALGAATACSKPVSDMGWRPHSEHVGQTGKPVSSNLYIAIGISGAIQHIAGISSSKVKVVINNDPDAPFFKAADYGIIGDAFEIVPALTEKLEAR